MWRSSLQINADHGKHVIVGPIILNMHLSDPRSRAKAPAPRLNYDRASVRLSAEIIPWISFIIFGASVGLVCSITSEASSSSSSSSVYNVASQTRVFCRCQ